jgi:hypothetical protein
MIQIWQGKMKRIRDEGKLPLNKRIMAKTLKMSVDH